MNMNILRGRLDESHLEKYEFKRAFLHSNRKEKEDMVFVECIPRPCPGRQLKTEPAYFGHFLVQGWEKNTWIYFKGPSSKNYIAEWWDFFNEAVNTTEPLHKKNAKQMKTYLRNSTRFYKTRPETLPPEVAAGRVSQKPKK